MTSEPAPTGPTLHAIAVYHWLESVRPRRKRSVAAWHTAAARQIERLAELLSAAEDVVHANGHDELAAEIRAALAAPLAEGAPT